jgi:hypothetical protein
MSSDEWADLEAIERDTRPRLAERYGVCRYCHQGATGFLSLGPTVLHFYCECGSGDSWPPPDGMRFAGIEPLANVDEFVDLVELLKEVAPGTWHTDTYFPATNKGVTVSNPVKPGLRLDIRLLVPPGSPVDVRNLLPEIPEVERAFVTGRVLETIATHGLSVAPRERSGSAHTTWRVIRPDICPNTERTIDQILSSTAKIPSPVSAIIGILSVLADAGDVRRSLLAKRDAIEKALAQFDALEEIAR